MFAMSLFAVTAVPVPVTGNSSLDSYLPYLIPAMAAVAGWFARHYGFLAPVVADAEAAVSAVEKLDPALASDATALLGAHLAAHPQAAGILAVVNDGLKAQADAKAKAVVNEAITHVAAQTASPAPAPAPLTVVAPVKV